ncbi:hypothetical protein M408DRAFT_29559 [Serendipita vermifera MAFF 305830]|uniref:Uncharacterized protein n=1 Tax=Serendipita vermifera MAFF 305830 TaxID=933852 RepID=A0A0C3AN14_SERVB|nr:hypothetical protein M408DRAFT_29559 [Serendipita vermifera MAFF 305830]
MSNCSLQTDYVATDNYTITITAEGAQQGGSAFYFDFLTVLLPDSVANSAGRVIVNNMDSTQWKYKGDWMTLEVPGNYLYTIHQTQDAGMSVTLPFKGTDITVYGTLNGKYSDLIPIGYFQIDSGENHTVLPSDVTSKASTNVGYALRQQSIFSATGLPSSQHTLTIVVPPNSASSTSFPSTSATATSSPLKNPHWFLDYAVYGQNGSGSSSIPISSSPSSTAPSTGAIAGGVIAAILALLAMIAAIFLWRRKMQSSSKAIVQDVVQSPLEDDVSMNPYSFTESSSGVELGQRPSSLHKPRERAPQVPRSPRSSISMSETLSSGVTMTNLPPADTDRYQRYSMSPISEFNDLILFEDICRGARRVHEWAHPQIG